MDQNCRTHSQQRWRGQEIYTNLKKILLHGAYWLNVTCSLYSDIQDLLPFLWHISYHIIGYICSNVCFQWPHTRLCQAMLAQVCLCSCLCPDHRTCTRRTHTANCQYKHAVGGGCQMYAGKHCVNMGALTAFLTCILGRCLLRMPSVLLYHYVLTQLPLYKYGRHFTDDFPNEFLWMTIYIFWLKFDWNLVQLKITQYWFKKWLSTE